MLTSIIGMLVATALASGSVQSATFSVDTTEDGIDAAPGNGVCADAAGACPLRAAIQEANALAGPDAIALGPGSFRLAISGTLENSAASGDLDIASEIDLTGAGEDVTIIDGAALDRVVDVLAGALLRLSDVSLTNGFQPLFNQQERSEQSGGGLLVRAGGNAELERVVVRDNLSQRDGGGISVYGGLVAARLRVLRNTGGVQSSSGGGIYVGLPVTQFQLDRCELSGNSGELGGGLSADAAFGTPSVSRCLIADNVARDGGGVAANFGDARWLFRNVTITGNDGGGIFGDGGQQLRFEHSTITANRTNSPNGGAAIADVRGPSSASFAPITLVNTIVFGNTQPAGNECHVVFASVIVSGGGTLRAPGNACRMRAGAGDVVASDAGLLVLTDNGGFSRTHALKADSPALETALAAVCVAVDQRDEPRPQDGDNNGDPRCDIGAYERWSPLFADNFE